MAWRHHQSISRMSATIAPAFPGGARLRPVPGVRPALAGCRAVKTARSRRGILPSTHLAREGRMTVTIGRRELVATASTQFGPRERP